MHELKHEPVTAPSRKATSGEQRHKQDVTIMLKNIGKSRADKAAIAGNKGENGDSKHPHKPAEPMNKRGKKKKNV